MAEDLLFPMQIHKDLPFLKNSQVDYCNLYLTLKTENFIFYALKLKLIFVKKTVQIGSELK